MISLLKNKSKTKRKIGFKSSTSIKFRQNKTTDLKTILKLDTHNNFISTI